MLIVDERILSGSRRDKKVQIESFPLFPSACSIWNKFILTFHSLWHTDKSEATISDCISLTLPLSSTLSHQKSISFSFSEWIKTKPAHAAKHIIYGWDGLRELLLLSIESRAHIEFPPKNLRATIRMEMDRRVSHMHECTVINVKSRETINFPSFSLLPALLRPCRSPLQTWSFIFIHEIHLWMICLLSWSYLFPECCWAAGTSNESEFDFLRRRARWMLVTVVAYSRPQMETYRILHDMKIEMDGGDIN